MKQLWLYLPKHRKQRKSIGFTMKNIGSNENAMVALRKHRNKQKSIGCIVKNIGTNEKAFV